MKTYNISLVDLVTIVNNERVFGYVWGVVASEDDAETPEIAFRDDPEGDSKRIILAISKDLSDRMKKRRDGSHYLSCPRR